MKIEYLSASRLNVFIDCPFRYFLQYHLELPELKQDTLATHKGKAVHETLDKYVKGSKDYVKELKDYYSNTKLWELDRRNERRGFPHPVEKDCGECRHAIFSSKGVICSIAKRNVEEFEGCPKPNFEDDLKLVKQTIHGEDTVLNRKIIGAEVEFNKHYEGFKVRGFMDLVTEIDEETLEVRDYKTGTYTKKTEEAFRDLQMRIYSLIAKELFPQYKYVLMTLDYLRKQPVTVIFGPEDDEKTREFLQDAYKKISEAKNPPRKKSFKCNWCVGYDKCGKIRESFLDENGEFVMPPEKEKEEKPQGKKLPVVGD